jgi:hypothetical protein
MNTFIQLLKDLRDKSSISQTDFDLVVQMYNFYHPVSDMKSTEATETTTQEMTDVIAEVKPTQLSLDMQSNDLDNHANDENHDEIIEESKTLDVLFPDNAETRALFNIGIVEDKQKIFNKVFVPKRNKVREIWSKKKSDEISSHAFHIIKTNKSINKHNLRQHVNKKFKAEWTAKDKETQSQRGLTTVWQTKLHDLINRKYIKNFQVDFDGINYNYIETDSKNRNTDVSNNDTLCA